LLHSFPSWFVGVAFAAIGIGALVPAAIMSIAAANLYTRNIHREFINRNPTDKQESRMAKLVSLIVKVGALVFILFVPTQYAIQLQLLGGIWIIQTLPSVMLDCGDRLSRLTVASRRRWNARLFPRKPRLSQNGNMQP
jgi:SSS family solute:Na+ symporter